MRVVLLLAALAATPAVAQSPLVFSRETLVYLDPLRDHATATNASADTVVVDSLAVRTAAGNFGGWHVSANVTGQPEDVYYQYIFIGNYTYYEPIEPPVVQPGGSLTISADGWDPCPVCHTAGGGRESDTLLVYAGGRSVPHRLILDLSRWVNAAPPPVALALALTVGPNPAGDAATLRLTLGTPAAFTAEAFDALGRRVASLHDGPLGAGPHALPVSTAKWPPGVYTVRARAGTQAVTVPLTVVR